MIYIGIDPGLGGAVGFIGKASAVVHDLPTLPLPGRGLVRRRIDGRALNDLIRENVPKGESVRVFVEMVRAMGGVDNAIQTQGSLSRTLGAIEAVLDILRVKPRMVEAKTWKGYYKVGSDKKASLRVARHLFPHMDELKREGDHNRAEALLIAYWGLKKT